MGTLRSNAKGMQEMIPSAIPLIFFQVAFYVFLVQATIIVIYDIKSLSNYLIRLFFSIGLKRFKGLFITYNWSTAAV